MKHQRLDRSIVALALLAVLCMRADAQAARIVRGPTPDRLQALNLSDEQKKAIREVLASERTSFAQLVRRLGEARAALLDAVAQHVADESAIRTRAKELADVHGDLAVLRASIGARIRPLLTQQQRARVVWMQRARSQRVRARAVACSAYLDALSQR